MTDRRRDVLAGAGVALVVVLAAVVLADPGAANPDPPWPTVCRVVQPEDLDR